MDQALDARKVTIGFHPDGYRIDKTASPMNKYTKWDILLDNHWCNPKPVCFDSLPQRGWVVKDKFDWGNVETPVDITEPKLLRSTI